MSTEAEVESGASASASASASALEERLLPATWGERDGRGKRKGRGRKWRSRKQGVQTSREDLDLDALERGGSRRFDGDKDDAYENADADGLGHGLLAKNSCSDYEVEAGDQAKDASNSGGGEERIQVLGNGARDVEAEAEDECRICGDTSFTKRNSLISPCACTGSISKVHVFCLEKWIMSRPGDRSLGSNLQCEICHVQYAVRLRHRLRLNASTLCSCATLAHVLEGAMLVVSLLTVLALLYAGLPALRSRDRPQDGAIIVCVALLVCTIALVGLRRLYSRWHRNTAVPRVVLLR